MHSPPVFSLVVPTLNRLKEVRELLLSLQSQTFKDFEVIIVDQNEDNRLEALVHEFSSALQIKHIRQKEKGASKARNNGMRYVTGSIVTFPDDDCKYSDKLLTTIYTLFLNHQEIDGMTCSSRDMVSGGSISRLSDIGGPLTKYNILNRLVEFTIFFKNAKRNNVWFDERFGPGASSNWWCDEGPDFVLQLMNEGYKFMYFPEIVIHHPDPAKIYDERIFQRSYKYGLGRGKFLRKHQYPLWYAMYVWALYVAGMCIGLVQLNFGKIKYYFKGLGGRIKGYLSPL